MENLGVAARGSPGSCPLDRLPDDLLLRILVIGAASDAYPEEFSDLRRLCQLRSVCHRFDDLLVQAEEIEWAVTPDTVRSTDHAHRFLRPYTELRALRLLIRDSSDQQEALSIPNSFWLAILGVTPKLAKLECYGPDTWGADLVEKQSHKLFKTLAMWPHLATFCLCSGFIELTESLSPRHTLHSIINLELRDVKLTDASFSSILDVCQQIEDLKLYRIEGLTSPTVASSHLKNLVLESHPEMATLKISTPQLRSLRVSEVTLLRIDAPNLERLQLSGTCPIVKESTWKVIELGILGRGVSNMEQLLSIVALCKDARSLKILASHKPFLAGALAPLPNFLQHLQNLEHLELPFNVAGHMYPNRDFVVSSRVSLTQLKKLKVSLIDINQVELCFELCSIAPDLVDLTINLLYLFKPQGGRADAVLMRFLELQRRYPKVKVVVTWPELRLGLRLE